MADQKLRFTFKNNTPVVSKPVVPQVADEQSKEKIPVEFQMGNSMKGWLQVGLVVRILC